MEQANHGRSDKQVIQMMNVFLLTTTYCGWFRNPQQPPGIYINLVE